MTNNKREKTANKRPAKQTEKKRNSPTTPALSNHLAAMSEEERSRLSVRVYQVICDIYSEKYDVNITWHLSNRDTGELHAIVKTGSTIEEALARAEEEKKRRAQEKQNTSD